MKSIRHAADLNPRVATDAQIRGPLWLWHPHKVQAVKSERRRRFKLDSDDDGLPPVLDE